MTVYAEVDLDDIRTQDLIEELESRPLDQWEIKSLTDLLHDEDARKMDLFFKVKDKFSVLELEELFKEKYIDAPIPKEQLTLAI